MQLRGSAQRRGSARWRGLAQRRGSAAWGGLAQRLGRSLILVAQRGSAVGALWSVSISISRLEVGVLGPAAAWRRAAAAQCHQGFCRVAAALCIAM